jgi:branched-chain amino acid transport system permease protein
VVTLDPLAQLTVEGLRFGLVLALAALGLSVIFGTTGLTNFSHGEIVTFGAIAAWLLTATGLPFLGAAVLAVVLSGLFGWAQDAVLWRPLRRRRTGLIAMMIVSIEAAVAQESEEIIRGVLRAEGERVAGVTITVSTPDGEEVGSAESDAEGAWLIPVPEEGAYTVVLDTATLPDGVPEVATDTVETNVGNTQSKSVLFRFGAPAGGDGGGGGADEQPSTGAVFSWDRVAQLTAEGLRFGIVLALAALGLSVIFGTTGLTNFAHGEIITFGAIAAWLLTGAGLPFLVAAVLAVVLTGGFGWAQDSLLWRPLRRRRTGLIAMMIVSIGLAIFLRYFYLYVFGGERRPYQQFAVQGGLELGPITLAPRDLISMAVAVVVLAGTVLALSRTRLGKATRAVSDNPALASATGIDVDAVIRVVWIGGAALAGLSGILLALSQQVDYQIGFRSLLLVFAAVVLGGLGTIAGSIVGALIVGLFLQLSTLVIPIELQNAGVLAVLIVVLLIRPQGILGRRERVG